MLKLKYLPEERKVLINEDIKMSEKMQQQLNYIANAIHDNVSTWDPSFLSIRYDLAFNDVSIGYYNQRIPGLNGEHDVQYKFGVHVEELIEGRTGININLFKYSFDVSSVFKKIAQKYFINNLYLPSKLEMSPNISEVLYALSPQLGKLTVDADLLPKYCNLLSKWISDDNFPKMIDLELYTNYEYNNDKQRAIENACCKILSVCESKQDSVITFLPDYYHHVRNPDTQGRIDKLQQLNKSRVKHLIESLVNMVKGYYDSEGEKEKYFKSEKFTQAFGHIIENNTLRLLWDLKDSHAMHTEILKRLRDETQISYKFSLDHNYTLENIKTAFEVLSRDICDKYIIPDIEDIKGINSFKGLSPKTKTIVLFRTKLPPEIQQLIVSKISMPFDTDAKKSQEISALKKVFALPALQDRIAELNDIANSRKGGVSDLDFTTEELQQINTMKEIFVLLDKIETAATADDIQLDELLNNQLGRLVASLSPELQSSIKHLHSDAKISVGFSGTEAELYATLQSTANEVEDLPLTLQEQATEVGAEAAISDNVPAYDTVDSNNTIYQLPENLLLAGNDQNFCTMPQF